MLTIFEFNCNRRENHESYCKQTLTIPTANYATFSLMGFSYDNDLGGKERDAMRISAIEASSTCGIARALFVRFAGLVRRGRR